MKYQAFMFNHLWKQLWSCKMVRLTFLQDNLYHDTVSGLGRLTPAAQRVAAVVVEVAVVSHVSSDPGHSRGGAEGARPAQLSYLYRTTQSPHTQAGPHHQSQQALFNLLPEKHNLIYSNSMQSWERWIVIENVAKAGLHLPYVKISSVYVLVSNESCVWVDLVSTRSLSKTYNLSTNLTDIMKAMRLHWILVALNKMIKC